MQLQTIPAATRHTAVLALLRSEGPLVAEHAIQVLADQEGDNAALAIVDTMPALAVADIVREFDYSKPSLVGMLVTPIMLRKIVERMPLLGDCGKRTLEVIASVVLLKEEWQDRAPFFLALGKSALGVQALALALLSGAQDRDTILFFARTGSFDVDESVAANREKADECNIPFGGWEELLISCKKHSPSVYRKVVELLQNSTVYTEAPFTSLERELVLATRAVFGGTSTGSIDPYAL